MVSQRRSVFPAGAVLSAVVRNSPGSAVRMPPELCEERCYRFDYVIPVGPPDPKARAAIWQRYLGPAADDIKLHRLVLASEMFTPADIEFAARKGSHAAFEREVTDRKGALTSTEDYLAAIADPSHTHRPGSHQVQRRHRAPRAHVMSGVPGRASTRREPDVEVELAGEQKAGERSHDTSPLRSPSERGRRRAGPSRGRER